MNDRELIEKLQNENAKQHEREKALVAEIERLRAGHQRPTFLSFGVMLIRPEVIHTVIFDKQGSWINNSIKATIHPLDLMKLIGAEVVAAPDEPE